jgi:hypothetical protein
MAQWLWRHKRDQYDMVFVFANTGQENEETLDFVQQCSSAFGFPVVWVEAVVDPESGKGTRHRIVDHATASRNGEPFEAVIAKYGIPNQSTPHCSRELKERSITSYARSLWGNDYDTAIGIRSDEFDRVNERYKERRLVYPLVRDMPMTKPKVNFWWSQQSFRLQLKGYEGNCKTCWKKSNNKLMTIAKERPDAFDWMRGMEQKYGEFVPEARLQKMQSRGSELRLPIRFFRGHKSCVDIINEASAWNGAVVDDAAVGQLELDSCEVFSSCSE